MSEPVKRLPAAASAFACPACGAKYRWKADLASKKIRCKHCSGTFWPAGDPEQQYAAAVTAAGARGGYAMLAPKSARRVQTEEDELTALHNWVLPGIVLAAGGSWRLWQAIGHAARYESVAAWQSIMLVIAEWLAVSIAVAGGVLVSALFIDIDLDKLGRAALKVVSTAILMCAVAQFCSSFDRVPEDMWGMIQGVPCVLLLAFFMLVGMFKADLLEALMGSVAITLFVVGVMAALAFTMQNELGSILSFGRPAQR